ncbi:Signal transduction histidine kinase [Aliiroseovarius halocynthiae]|uniref:histidine kinase n=1 Tax=Aliiroseovarius halocynthiae TaxID=985055 RepID=A0A545SQB1_9RHOB|nr:HAMP domain-containing sensor histidine kinase [Aliiroseovarius halocynthiae]TQV67158.1 HAMP domain-containing histidine kinase [Aliiroseovarius halocynthiae]SMR82112.1 Signal transduction histidine kinase [Aliiroseovarius halocynthiae]
MFLSQRKGFLRQSAIRQALGLLAVFALISTVTWAATYFLVMREIYRMVDARLAAQMTATIETLESNSTLPSPGIGQSIAVMIDSQIRYGSLPFDIDVKARPDGFFERHAGSPFAPDYRHLLQTTDHGRIIISENVERQDELLDVLLAGLQVALLGSLIAALLTGLLIGRRNQLRLDAISDGLAEVARGNLGARINLPDQQDDLSLLANRIDITSQRLERTIEQIRVQSSNIAHDLRTPLARLRALIETQYIALTEKNDVVSPNAIEAALEQIDRIVGTFDALLRISRIESGTRREAFADLDLAKVIQSVEETFGPVVEDAGNKLSVSVSEPAQISGDRDLLLQLFANLLQNALRYGPEGQTITLAILGNEVSVSDQGPGIPVAEQEKVLEPLYQLHDSRQGEGFGLGLSLVRAISELHGAVLTLSEGPDQKGLKVTLSFPDTSEFQP